MLEEQESQAGQAAKMCLMALQNGCHVEKTLVQARCVLQTVTNPGSSSSKFSKVGCGLGIFKGKKTQKERLGTCWNLSEVFFQNSSYRGVYVVRLVLNMV